jgi:hypothetical protein
MMWAGGNSQIENQQSPMINQQSSILLFVLLCAGCAGDALTGLTPTDRWHLGWRMIESA